MCILSFGGFVCFLFVLLLLNIKKNESWFLVSSLTTSSLQEDKIFHSWSLEKKLKVEAFLPRWKRVWKT